MAGSGLTRNPDANKARAIAQLGAEAVKADMSDPLSLEHAFGGAHGDFSVQNHHISGYEGEVRQGTQVAEWPSEWASPARLQRSWSRRQGQRRWLLGDQDRGGGVIRTLELPATILHPTAFMELMTEPKFFPPASVWHLMPKLMGPAQPVGG